MSEFFERISKLSPKRLTLLVMDMQARLEALEHGQAEPIAVIGAGCRFPGGADSLDAYWRLLRDGVDAISEMPADRWDVDGLYDPDPEAPGKIASRWGGYLDGIDRFDPQFFGIAPREAMSMDPQQRLLLEVAWEALEHAGQAPDRLSGSPTGVFVGVCNGDYYQLLLAGDLAALDTYAATGNAPSVAAGRLSYVLGLQGPSLSIDTACSSSLVAIHTACQSLRNRECRMALAGGVNALLSPNTTIVLSRARMMAADGRCKAFDAAADGFVRSEGCGVVVLKRLSDALADGDTVLAVIRGTATNQDGRSNGLTAPNGPSQVGVIRAALADAGVEPREISYVEAHGTGTALGDPIEVQALGAALGAGRAHDRPLLIGSVKTNLGHMESAAGVAGLLKVALAFQHEEIPPQLHLKEPNPYIPWAELPVSVTTRSTPWPAGRRLAGVSSFGFSGTNAHIILEAPPAATPGQPGVDRPLHLMTLSARDEAALDELAARYAAALADPQASLADMAFTAGAGRAHFGHRLALAAPDADGARAQLAAYLADDETEPAVVLRGQAPDGRPPRIAFLFTGQGSHYAGLGRRLYETQPTFREALDRCAELLRPHLDRPLHEILWPAGDGDEPAYPALMENMAYAQPALFAFEYALAELWRAWGVTPAAVMGHSAGEYVAACLAGVFSLEDGLKLIAARGRLMQALPPDGEMASIRAGEARVEAAIAPYAGRVAIAAVNGPESVVISGLNTAVQAAVDRLKAEGLETRRLAISIAAHSPLVEPMLDPFERVAATIAYAPPQVDFISCVTGEQVAGPEIATPAYWRRHAREPVRFAAGIQALHRLSYDLFIEVGPNPTLLGMGRHCLAEGAAVWLPSLRSGVDDWTQLLTSLGTLYVQGAKIDWAGFDRDYPRRRTSLPTYPFQRSRYWLAPARPVARLAAGDGAAHHQLLGGRLRSPALADVVFETALSAAWPPFLDHHRIIGAAVLPAPAYVEMAITAAGEALGLASPTLEDLAIQEALVLPDDGARPVQVILTPDDDGASFRVVSRDERADDWIVHATGLLRGAPAGDVDAPPADLEAARGRCAEMIAGAAYYAQLRALGLEFGPGFRGIADVWRRDGEAIAAVDLPAELADEGRHYGIHPALLDACFHTLGAAVPATDAAAVHLLVGLRRFRLLESPTGRVWSHARLDLADGAAAEMIGGDLRLYDGGGRLMAEVEGIRLKRAGRQALLRATGQRVTDWLYEVQWQACEALPDDSPRPTPARLPAPAGLIDHLRARAAAAADEHGLGLYELLLPALAAASAGYVRRALTDLGWSFGVGQRVTVEGLAERLGIVAAHRRLLGRLLEMLAEDGVVRRDAGEWEVRRPLPAAEEPISLDRLRAAYPAAEAEVTLLASCGERLADVLRGECDPLDLLFPGGSTAPLERLYRSAPFARFNNALVQAAVAEALGRLPAGRGVRVLEIGAGTGATTAAILPVLPADRADYLFTDVSPIFTARAAETFGAYPFVRYGVLDIEAEPEGQGLGPHQFDLIVAANVLHATGDLRQALAHVRRLLAPGGLLLLLEGSDRERWVDLTFGLTAGWWAFHDAALRPDYPLLVPSVWEALLDELGFGDVATLPGRGEAARPGQQTILLARAPETAPPAAGGDEWLILADAGGVADELAELLQARGDRFLLVRPGAPGWSDAPEPVIDPTQADDYRDLLHSAWSPAAVRRRIVHLWSLDLPAGDPGDGSLGCASVLHLLQAIDPAVPPPQLWLVTRGAQPAGDEAAGLNPAAAPLWGLGRVIALEQPERWGGLIDLGPRGVDEARRLLAEIRNSDGEDQVALVGQRRLVARLARRAAPSPRALRLQPDATYLITGGLGGLGLGVARWLVESGARHLVLLGRRGLPERAVWPELAPESPAGQAAATIRDLEGLGARVAVMAADVGDRARLAEVFAEVGATMPSLRGVIHAAAALSAATLAEMSPATLAAMLAPKATGAWLLHELTRAMSLDFFVMFSSTTALLGSRELGHYAAANAFLDALAHYRQRLGLPALSVNWGTWDVMRGASADYQHLTARFGLQRMASGQALAALADALGQPEIAQLAVAAIDWAVLKPAYEARRRRPFLGLIGAPARAATRPARGVRPDLLQRLADAWPESRRDVLEAHIRREVAAVLGLDAALLRDSRQGLFELGMDSLMSVELKGRLETAVGQALPSTLTFNYPSVLALTDYLASDVLKLETAPTPTPEVPPTQPVAAASDDGTADLSEDELAALLSAKLARLR